MLTYVILYQSLLPVELLQKSSSNFYIGGEPGRSHVIERAIDEVAVFNTVLTDADVKAIYQNGLERALGITAVSPKGKLALRWGGLKRR